MKTKACPKYAAHDCRRDSGTAQRILRHACSCPQLPLSLRKGYNEKAFYEKEMRKAYEKLKRH